MVVNWLNKLLYLLYKWDDKPWDLINTWEMGYVIEIIERLTYCGRHIIEIWFNFVKLLSTSGKLT